MWIKKWIPKLCKRCLEPWKGLKELEITKEKENYSYIDFQKWKISTKY